MKKNTIFMCLSLGLAGLLSSCSSFDNPYEPKEVASEKGLLTLNLASGVEFTTRAANESDWTNLENYNITIKKEGGEAVTKPYSEWGFPWACDEGTYSVTAFKGEEKAYSHDTFYATGNGSCTVEKGKESKAEITVSPTAGKVIVEYDPELSTYCSDYSIDFSGTTAMGSEIAHTDKANNEGPWYFAIKKGGETVNYTINLTAKSDYTKEGSATGSFVLEPNQVQKLTIKAHHDEYTQGGIIISITIDKETDEKPVDVEVPVTWVN